MKDSLIIIGFFAVGILLGVCGLVPSELIGSGMAMYALYALIFSVGFSVGNNPDILKEFKKLNPRLALLPVMTIFGTLAATALLGIVLPHRTVPETMAVGSGFAYYSLSSILITQFKEPSIGLQLATELGTIALLSNIIREMMALLGSPLIEKYFGKLAPISAAGVNSMDVVLPAITRYSGKEMIPVAILHGILIDFSVPLFVSFFCSL